MTPLGELIVECQRAFLDEHGVELSYGDIARRSGTPGITRGRVQQLAKGQIKAMPLPETIDALSLGLGVSRGLVLQRAMESSGYDLPSEFTLAARRMPKRRRPGDAEPS